MYSCLSEILQLSEKVYSCLRKCTDVCESVKLLGESVQLSDESVQLSDESVRLSRESVQLSDESVQLSGENVQLSFQYGCIQSLSKFLVVCCLYESLTKWKNLSTLKVGWGIICLWSRNLSHMEPLWFCQDKHAD